MHCPECGEPMEYMKSVPDVPIPHDIYHCGIHGDWDVREIDGTLRVTKWGEEEEQTE